MSESLTRVLNGYADEVRRLSTAETTREETYYPAMRNLLSGLLASMSLPFDVRVNTSERRSGGGTDVPDPPRSWNP